jgi:glycosyltransferase involved in cell wall biosynthesis
MNVTVVIPTYNGANRLPDTLEALRRQAVDPSLRWEIVVVDNNSTDGTRGVVEHMARVSAVPIRYAFEAAQGANHARNRGISESHSEIVAFTDDDASPTSDWVQSVVISMSKWSADGVGGRILPRWLVTPPRWLHDRHLWAALAVRDSETLAEVKLDARGRFDQGVEIWGANMAFRRSLFSDVGMFDPTIGHRGNKLVGGDEVEFVRRAIAAHRRLIYDPGLLVWHRIGLERTQPWFYRRKWFYIGENLPLTGARSARRRIFGVPFFHIRFVAIHLATWVKKLVRRDDHSFCSELELWRDAGFIAACIKAAWHGWRGITCR